MPPAAEPTAVVRQRLETERRQRARQRRRARPGSAARWRVRILYPRWRAALIAALTVVALAVAIPQSRAAIAHVLRLDGVEWLGQPTTVTVSDGGRVATLSYDRTPYGQVRLDEFAGHLDQVYFEKFVQVDSATEVRLNGAKGLWVPGPQEVIYVRSDGTIAQASARLTTGRTLIWGTPRVVLRLEGGFSKTAALAVADSAR